jgi:hypothetical protein
MILALAEAARNISSATVKTFNINTIAVTKALEKKFRGLVVDREIYCKTFAIFLKKSKFTIV